jgi:hypothetical protein
VKTLRIISTTILPLALPLLDIVTIKHTYDFKGDFGPEFYGLPFIYRTEIPWGSSLSGEFYLVGYFGNVFFYSLVVLAITLLLMKLKLNTTIKKLWTMCWFGIASVLIVFAVIFFLITDWRYAWTNSEILHYANHSINYAKTIEFFSMGK